MVIKYMQFSNTVKNNQNYIFLTIHLSYYLFIIHSLKNDSNVRNGHKMFFDQFLLEKMPGIFSSGGISVNILHIAPLYYPTLGGTEIHTRELSLQLAKEGNPVTIYTTDALSPIGLFKKTKDSLKEGIFKDSQVPIYRFHVFNDPISRLPSKYIWIICTAMKEFLQINQPFDFAEALWNTPVVPKWYIKLLGTVDFDITNVTNFPLGHCYFLRYVCNKKHIPFIITPRTHAFDPTYRKPFLIKKCVKS